MPVSSERFAPAATRQPGRVAVKQNRILELLRGQIVSGRFAPGAQLPLRSVLQRRFNASTATMQSVLNRLIQDGFVQARGRRGTFVVSHPPHLCHYGIALPRSPGSGAVRSRLWTALVNEAARISQADGQRRVGIYRSIDGHMDTESCQKLLSDMRNQRLAGVMYSFIDREVIAESPLLDEPRVPQVAFTTGPTGWSIPTVSPDFAAWIDRALECLQQRRRRRVGLITVSGTPREQLDHFLRAASARQLEVSPRWIQCVPWPELHWASHLAQVVLHPGQRSRPDGMILLDDNVVEHATAGMLAAGVRVPQDLDVVAHCNLPDHAPSVLQFQHLGFDVGQLLATGMRLIDQQRRGQRAARSTRLTPVFSSEMKRT